MTSTEDLIAITIEALARDLCRVDDKSVPMYREAIGLVKRVPGMVAPSTDDDIEEAADWVDGLRNNPADCNGPPPWVENV